VDSRRESILAFLKTREHFHSRSGTLSQRDVTQACNLVLVQHVNPLELTPLDHCGPRYHEGRPLAAGKPGSTKQA